MINIPFNFLDYWPSGSRYICNPPPTDTDNDTVILAENIAAACDALVKDGWEYGGSYVIGDYWFSYKKTVDGVVENFIVTQDSSQFAKWKKATELCKTLNLLNKNDRVAVFRAIVDDK